MVAAHGQQVRKIDSSPYIVHPTTVALAVAKHGFSDAAIAAALVHDVLEDTSYTEQDLRAELGDEVCSIVLALTENKAMAWEERKANYMRTIAGAAPEVKAVSILDKIHNLRSILAGHAQIGPAMWEKFTRGREKQLWFMDEMGAAYQRGWQHELIAEFSNLLEEVRKLD
jgi:(p)ppGpp synthase/HD superfamily hydrolase